MPKESWEWNEADLEALIHQKVDENLELEYKSADALGLTDGKKNEISKDTSAFANSIGGTIVYGIRESNGSPPRVPEEIDGIDPAVISKEWLEQVINSRIHPRIDGVRINPINLSGKLAGETAYVVWVPQGATAHQASDYRYYKRFNFESVPMEHYEIMDVFNRVVHPKVIAKFSGLDRQPLDGYDRGNVARGKLSIRLINEGNRVADRVSVQFWIPAGYVIRGIYEGLVQNMGNSVVKDEAQVKEYIYYHRQPNGIYPLFPNLDQEILDGNPYYLQLEIQGTKEEDSKTDLITWRVYADDASPEEGQISIYELFFPVAADTS